MDLQGLISQVLPANSGISQRTGTAWMSQEFVMQYYWFPNQTQPSYIVLRAFGEDKIKNMNLQVGDEVKVRFHAEAHESNGRWFNELRIDGVTFIGVSAAKEAARSTAGAQGQGMVQGQVQGQGMVQGQQNDPFPPAQDGLSF